LTNFLKESKWSVLRYFANYFDVTISGRFILKVWYTMNILTTLFFGFIHQGGVIQLNEFMSTYSQQAVRQHSQIHLVTSHTYKLPESMFVLPSSAIVYTNSETGMKHRNARRFFIYEYGSMDIELMFKRMKVILDAAELKLSMKNIKYEVLVAIPSSKAIELTRLFSEHSKLMNYNEVQIFYPHLSTEAFPDVYTTHHPCEINTDVDELDKTCSVQDFDDLAGDEMTVASVLRRVSSIAHQFGLMLYRVEVKRRRKKDQQ
jgi:phosphatidylinositol glycan class Z